MGITIAPDSTFTISGNSSVTFRKDFAGTITSNIYGISNASYPIYSATATGPFSTRVVVKGVRLSNPYGASTLTSMDLQFDITRTTTDIPIDVTAAPESIVVTISSSYIDYGIDATAQITGTNKFALKRPLPSISGGDGGVKKPTNPTRPTNQLA